VFDASSVARQTLFQSGWFVVGLLTQTLVVHMLRTPKLPFVQSRAAWPLIGMTLAIMAVGLWLPVLLQAAGPASGLLRLAGRHPGGLLHTDHLDEAPVHPALRLAMRAG
jgi:Mg2+-importing ATPase